MKRIFSTILTLFLSVLTLIYAGGVRRYGVKVTATYPHDVTAYTQGLFFNEGTLYESTGQYGESTLRKVELESGKVLLCKKIGKKYFGEGSCIVNGRMYVLTWQNKLAFEYDPEDFTQLRQYSYFREGWGLAALPAGGKASMVASDGTSTLYYLDSGLKTLSSIKVTYNGRPVAYLNELEWIGGRIWANVYTSDTIVIIHPSTGVVEGIIDCSTLIPASERTAGMDVLNGIAQGPDGSIYLTGKNWPKMFKIELTNKL